MQVKTLLKKRNFLKVPDSLRKCYIQKPNFNHIKFRNLTSARNEIRDMCGFPIQIRDFADIS